MVNQQNNCSKQRESKVPSRNIRSTDLGIKMKFHVFVLMLLSVTQYSIARSVVQHGSQQRNRWTAEKRGGFQYCFREHLVRRPKRTA